jgi:hypothetical protein
MKIRNGESPIQLPDLIRAGDPITAKWANGIRSSLQRLRDRSPSGTSSRQYVEQNPFQLTLGRDPVSDAYYVTVAQGFVAERALAADNTENALILHECDNRLDVNDDPTKFTLTVGDGIFVQVKEDDFGRVLGGEDLILVVINAGSTDAESRNYIPDTIDGVYNYKLATLVANGSGVKLEPFLTGSHIYHSTGLTADFRIMNCPTDPEVLPTQLVRLSFVSGKLHSVGESVEVRPLATTLEEKGFDVETCT